MINLPDWKDSSQYPDPESTSDTKWAWEFLRRNVDYQTDYHEFISKLPKGLYFEFGLTDDDKNDEYSDEEYFTWLPVFKGILNKFGLKTILVPPEVSSQELASRVLGLFASSSSPKFLHKPEGAQETKPMNPESDSEVIVKFNLDLPIDPQYKQIKKHLIALQKRKERLQKITPVKIRKRRDKYQTYLRLLDADFANVKHEEIADYIFPEKPNGYPDYLGNNAVRDGLKAATKILTGDYKYLPFRAGK